jgi:hypothetical protein
MVIRESITDPGIAQSGGSKNPELHFDPNIGGAMNEDGSLVYDGILLANNIPNSCAIVKDLVKYPNLMQSYKDKVYFQQRSGEVFMKPNQFYWFMENTLHRVIALPNSEQRQFIAFTFGEYLYRNN